MDSQTFRKAAHDSLDLIIDYYDTMESRKTLPDVQPGYLRELVPTSAPEQGEEWGAIQKDISEKIMPGLTHWQSPKFMAFFPGHCTYPSMLGELFSAAFTAPAFNWQCSPAITELETIVLDWMAQLLHLPDCFLSKGEGGGTVMSGTSEAIATTMVCARERAVRDACEGLEEGEARQQRANEVRNRLVSLSSDQTHSSTPKAAVIAGTRYRSIATSFATGLRLTPAALRRALEQCRADGLQPYYITLNFGTTSTCAVDDFIGCAEVLKDWPGLWVHVDGAHAGSSLALEEYAHLAKPFSSFDSFTINMHKWLLVNFDAGLLFVRRRRNLTDALSIMPSYLRNKHTESGLVTDYRDWQFPLGRRFRALKIWFVLRTYGVQGIKAYLRNHVTLGEEFAGWVRGRADLFELVAEPAFALTAFTIAPGAVADGGLEDGAQTPEEAEDAAAWTHAGPAAAVALARDESEDVTSPRPGKRAIHLAGTGSVPSAARVAANAVAQAVYEHINGDGDFFLTSTVIDGVYAVRVVSANPNAKRECLRAVFDLLVLVAEEKLAAARADAGATGVAAAAAAAEAADECGGAFEVVHRAGKGLAAAHPSSASMDSAKSLADSVSSSTDSLGSSMHRTASSVATPTSALAKSCELLHPGLHKLGAGEQVAEEGNAKQAVLDGELARSEQVYDELEKEGLGDERLEMGA